MIDEDLSLALKEIADITASSLSNDLNRKTLIKTLVMESINIYDGDIKYRVNGYRSNREGFLIDLEEKYPFLIDSKNLSTPKTQ